MSLDSPLVKALDLFSEGRPHDAEQLLRENGESAACQGFLRDYLISEKRDDEALAVAQTLSNGTGPEAVVSQAFLAFKAEQLQAALQQCQTALQQDPNCSSAHHHAGRILHNAGQPPQALEALKRASQIDPQHASIWLSLGHAQRANGDLDSAIESFRKARKVSPGIASARHNLGITLFHADRPDLALEQFDQLLERYPDHTDGLVDRGLTLMLLGRLDLASTSLERAIELAPDHALAWLYLGQLHNELTDTDRALTCLQKATSLDPGDVEAWIELTGVFEQANRVDEAIDALGQGFAADPHHPGLHLEGAKLERRRGDSAAAVRRLSHLQPQQLPPRVAQQYGFEYGLALDRDNKPERALEAFALGNRLARQGARASRTDAHALERRCVALEQWIDAGAPGMKASPTEDDGKNAPGESLCFLVGFPRSGTTLVDTTLATSKEVVALEEAPTLDPLIRELEAGSPPYPACLAGFTASDAVHGRAVYEGAVHQLLGTRDERLLIDKMPLRFMHAGLIQRLFPGARMVFVARHPCDVVLSNFMQQYAVNETNIHFDTLEHSAQTYARIMGLWLKLAPRLDMPLLTVRYEDLVSDLKGEIHPICEFLELDSSQISTDRDARLETRDRVRTSSYQQVAEPIYQRASGRWKRYERQLEPFMPLLAPAMDALGYER